MTFISIQPTESYDSIPFPKKKTPSKLTKAVHSLAKVHQEWQATKKNWHERTISKLDSYDLLLEEKLPNFKIQDKIDRLGRNIKEKFAPLKEFNTWLNSNGHGAWYMQLATFLVKLPLRAMRNIIKMLFDIVKAAIYSVVHPLKALNHLAKLIVNLIYELTKPETWTKIGVGVMGASLGQLAVSGNPLSAIGLGVGAALAITGLTIGALQAALEVEDGHRKEAALQNLLKQVKGMPESALTGFCMGLLIGGISKATATTGVGESIPRRESISILDMFNGDEEMLFF